MDNIKRHLGQKMLKRDSRVFICEPLKKQQTRSERILKEGSTLSYKPDDTDNVGLYISGDYLTASANYFEIEILDHGLAEDISIGLVSLHHPLDQHPGMVPESIGCHAGEGRLYKESSKEAVLCAKCEVGDKIGCGIKFSYSSSGQDNQNQSILVFFTINGIEMGSFNFLMPLGGLYPAVGLHSTGEEVKLSLKLHWEEEEETKMYQDGHEDEWLRLHEVHLNGSVLDYRGNGKSIMDVGLAQARHPLNITCHYFELEILDPGESCYIAIGLARRDYPQHRHPGWNKGSIAYHADDGKLFVGSGYGESFGPPCHKGDIMGCGILFSDDTKYNSDCSYDSDEEDLDLISSDSETDWWKGQECFENTIAVKVFFTRNGHRLGERSVPMPKGGFYPTVGMLSLRESVRVDLHPLTG